MRLIRLSIVSLAAALLLFGCASSGDGDAGSEDLAEPEAADTAEDGAEDPAGAVDPQVDTGERAVIYEAVLGVSDDDPERVAEDAWTLAESFGGFVTADERDRLTGDDEAYSSAHLVLRIPSEHFSEAMSDLSGLADSETSRSVTTEDVTEATVDLAAHIATQRASVDRVRELLAEAESITTILDLETELAEREGQLASLESQLEDLTDRVALSTIDLTVTAPAAPPAKEESSGPDNFWDGLVVGFSGAVTLLVGLSILLGVLLPFTPIAALVAAAIVLPLRWSRKRRMAKAASSPAPYSPLPPAPLAPPVER